MTDQNPKKSLGQHWLEDAEALERIVDCGEVGEDDVVLEIGPGKGSLTELLVDQAQRVVAVEKDSELISQLQVKFPRSNLGNNLGNKNAKQPQKRHSGLDPESSQEREAQILKQVQNDNDRENAGYDLENKLKIVHEDIREYDLNQLPTGYKVVANIPYYLTSHLLRLLLESENPPKLAALLVQQEVAERVVAQPGEMSVLALSVQYYSDVSICGYVPKEKFDPPPQVDSAILQLRRRSKPYFPADTDKLFRLIKAGFSQSRKQLKNSLSAGLKMDKNKTEGLIKQAGIDPKNRAEDLGLDQWQKLYNSLYS